MRVASGLVAGFVLCLGLVALAQDNGEAIDPGDPVSNDPDVYTGTVDEEDQPPTTAASATITTTTAAAATSTTTTAAVMSGPVKSDTRCGVDDTPGATLSFLSGNNTGGEAFNGVVPDLIVSEEGDDQVVLEFGVTAGCFSRPVQLRVGQGHGEHDDAVFGADKDWALESHRWDDRGDRGRGLSPGQRTAEFHIRIVKNNDDRQAIAGEANSVYAACVELFTLQVTSSNVSQVSAPADVLVAITDNNPSCQ